jgi:AcrR family transcriptional regulator
VDPPRSGRERLLRTAAELFYERGFHAVGVDLIVERCGVAKTTLYRHFPSKDALVAAYLEDANRAFWDWFEAAIDPTKAPRDQLVGLFEALEHLATSPTCHGCIFQVTAAEFPEAAHPGHEVAVVHKQAVQARLAALATAADAEDPDALADALLLVMDGAFAAARMFGQHSPAACAGDAARRLVDSHISA